MTRLLHSAERCAFLVHRQAFSEPARHAMIGGRENEDVAHLVPQRRAPVEVAGLARRRAVHGHDFAEGDAERAESRHAHGAHGEILVVGIDLDLHRTGQRHVVLLLVGRENRVQLRLHVGKQQRGFSLVELEDGRVVAKGVEVLVAVEQAQAVDRCGVAIAVVVAQAPVP